MVADAVAALGAQLATAAKGRGLPSERPTLGWLAAPAEREQAARPRHVRTHAAGRGRVGGPVEGVLHRGPAEAELAVNWPQHLACAERTRQQIQSVPWAPLTGQAPLEGVLPNAQLLGRSQWVGLEAPPAHRPPAVPPMWQVPWAPLTGRAPLEGVLPTVQLLGGSQWVGLEAPPAHPPSVPPMWQLVVQRPSGAAPKRERVPMRITAPDGRVSPCSVPF